MATYRTQAEWAEIVKAFKKSGQTQVAFCRENGLSEKTLGSHVRAGEEQKQKIKRSEEDWAILIAEQRDSGMNRSAWCKKHGISPESMASAEKRVQHSQSPTGSEWIEFSPKSKKMTSSGQKQDADWGVRIRSGNIDIDVNIDYPIEKLAILIGKLVKEC